MHLTAHHPVGDMLRITFCLALMLAVAACQSGTQPDTETPQSRAEPVTLRPLGYDLKTPKAVFDLPSSLREISGITYFRDGLLAAVQDERGDLFILDSRTGKVREQRVFGPNADYEDLVYVDDRFYVLQSNGRVLTFRYDETFAPGGVLLGGERSSRVLKIGVPEGSNVEGLGYDKKTDRLLLAIKEIKDAEEPEKRYVYFYDFGRKASWKGIVLSPMKFRQEARLTGEAAVFNPSAVAVHPRTNEVFLLSSDGHKLLRIDRMGIIRSVAWIDATTFPQPEGLCFGPDGTLYLTSEGKKGAQPGRLAVFEETPADATESAAAR